MISGEVVRELKTRCTFCKETMELDVLESGAGYYLGFWCNNCGPYSRESGYFATEEQAEKVLKEWTGKKD